MRQSYPCQLRRSSPSPCRPICSQAAADHKHNPLLDKIIKSAHETAPTKSMVDNFMLSMWSFHQNFTSFILSIPTSQLTAGCCILQYIELTIPLLTLWQSLELRHATALWMKWSKYPAKAFVELHVDRSHVMISDGFVQNSFVNESGEMCIKETAII